MASHTFNVLPLHRAWSGFRRTLLAFVRESSDSLREHWSGDPDDVESAHAVLGIVVRLADQDVGAFLCDYTSVRTMLEQVRSGLSLTSHLRVAINMVLLDLTRLRVSQHLELAGARR